MKKYLLIFLLGTNLFAQGFSTSPFMGDLCRTSSTPAQVYTSLGTLPDAQFPATLPAASGANLTALNGSQVTSGTIPLSQMPSLGAAYGAALTNNQTTPVTFGSTITGNGSGLTNVPVSGFAGGAVFYAGKTNIGNLATALTILIGHTMPNTN